MSLFISPLTRVPPFGILCSAFCFGVGGKSLWSNCDLLIITTTLALVFVFIAKIVKSIISLSTYGDSLICHTGVIRGTRHYSTTDDGGGVEALSNIQKHFFFFLDNAATDKSHYSIIIRRECRNYKN